MQWIDECWDLASLVKCCFKQSACRRLWVINVVIKQTVMGHERGCFALAWSRMTYGSDRYYQLTDRTIMSLMEGNMTKFRRRERTPKKKSLFCKVAYVMQKIFFFCRRLTAFAERTFFSRHYIQSNNNECFTMKKKIFDAIDSRVKSFTDANFQHIGIHSKTMVKYDKLFAVLIWENIHLVFYFKIKSR